MEIRGLEAGGVRAQEVRLVVHADDELTAIQLRPMRSARHKLRAVGEFVRRSARVLVLDSSDRLLLVQSGGAPGFAGCYAVGAWSPNGKDLLSTNGQWHSW